LNAVYGVYPSQGKVRIFFAIIGTEEKSNVLQKLTNG